VNLGELRSATRELLGDETPQYLWPDATLDRFLNNAVREACIRARLLKNDWQTLPELCRYVVTAGESLIQLKPEVLVVRSGRLLGCDQKLWALTAESRDHQCSTWDSDSDDRGTPRYLVMDLAQKTVRLYPTPDIDGSLYLRVWRTPLPAELMSDAQPDPVIALPDPEELKHWAAHEAYMIKDTETFDPARSANHLAIFEQRFGSRPSLHEMARWADSPPRVRHATMF
jgi:hypothetical protein